MGTIILTKERPKTLHWKVEVDGRDFENEEALLDIVRNVLLRGSVSYMKTNFRDPKNGIRRASSRQRHFNDGYWVYTFWFTKKRDAALFRLMAG